jgi:NADPH2:quinone reductase
MKAAVYDEAGGPNVLKYIDVPSPAIRPDDVLISVEAISIEGGDLINRRSNPPPHPSWIGGYAASGTIVAVGTNVEGRKIGDRVAAFDLQGSHAELWAVPTARTWLVPDGVDTAAAAVLPISFGTAYHCLFTRGGLQGGETVLIHAAAGGVGLAAVQLAAEAGATVIAVASGEKRKNRLLSLGADYVIDRTSHDVVFDVMQLTRDTGVDLVIDPVGTTLQASISALAPEGRLVFVGNAGGGSLSVDLWSAMQSNQTLLGVFMGPLLERSAVRSAVDRIFQKLASKRIQVVIERTFSLSEVETAHQYAETAKPLGRVVMKP